jgi:phosphatidylserine decarboxylase
MVIAATVLALAAAAAGWVFRPLAAVPLAALACVLAFFRDPRRAPEEPQALLSPADGRVTDVCPLTADDALGTAGVRIGVFMSIADVHVNRSPWAGRVERIDHKDGGYVDARRPAAAEVNEATTIRLICPHAGREHPVIVRQVAGLVARRIVTDLRAGQEVAAGQRIGMIKFGSRVELWVPDELIGELTVRVGDRVRAGRTAMVRLPGRPPEEPA